jgi:hypothetical protein
MLELGPGNAAREDFAVDVRTHEIQSGSDGDNTSLVTQEEWKRDQCPRP